jgi:hypothetical protein
MMTQKIRIFGCLSCLLCAGSVLAQIPASVAPAGSASVSGSDAAATVIPTGYTASLLNYGISGGSASINSSVDASIRSSYEPSMGSGLKDNADDNLPVSSDAGNRPSPFSAKQLPMAGALQFGSKDGFRGGMSTGVAMGGAPTIASRLSEVQAWSGAGLRGDSSTNSSSQTSGHSLSAKAQSLGLSSTDTGQMSGHSPSAKPQSSEFSSQQAFGAMGKTHETTSDLKMAGAEAASASYTPYGFPDSTMGTAIVSPPETDYGELFARTSSSTLAFALPNLDSHEFLAPSLRINVRRSAGARSLEQKLRERLKNGDNPMEAETDQERSQALHRMASESDIDRLRRQLKSPLDRPITNPLGSGSSRIHSPLQ